jgi:threonine dehydratase
MADPLTSPPLTPASIRNTYTKIKPYIHKTPLLTSAALNAIASSTDPSAFLSENPPTFQSQEANSAGRGPVGADGNPRFRLWFKCENFQKIGAFKARGAFHAVLRLIEELGVEEVRRRGVVTHSSGK